MERDPSDSGTPFEALVARTEGLQPWRRIFHAASGILLALTPGWLGWEPPRVTILLAVGTASLFILDAVRLTVPSLNRLFFVTFRTLASPREAEGIASSTWYALGATLVWLAAPGTPAMAALLVLALADPAASVIGRRWGRAKLGKGTWEGSAVFLVVAALVLGNLVSLPIALLVALVVTLVEILPWRVDDNLSVPLATALLLRVLPTVSGV